MKFVKIKKIELLLRPSLGVLLRRGGVHEHTHLVARDVLGKTKIDLNSKNTCGFITVKGNQGSTYIRNRATI